MPPALGIVNATQVASGMFLQRLPPLVPLLQENLRSAAALLPDSKQVAAAEAVGREVRIPLGGTWEHKKVLYAWHTACMASSGLPVPCLKCLYPRLISHVSQLVVLVLTNFIVAPRAGAGG